MQSEKNKRFIRAPGLMGGKAVIKGSRIPVDLILKRFACDLDSAALIADYPDLTEEDIKASIAYAKSLVEAGDRRRSRSRQDVG